MATCSAVMISTTFYRRFLKYLRHYHRLDGREAYRMLKDIYDDDYDGNDDWILWYKESVFYLLSNAHPSLINPIWPSRCCIKSCSTLKVSIQLTKPQLKCQSCYAYLRYCLPNRGLVAAMSKWIIVRFLAFLNEVVFRIYQQLVNGLTKSEQSTGVDFSTLPNLKQLLANLVVK